MSKSSCICFFAISNSDFRLATVSDLRLFSDAYWIEQKQSVPKVARGSSTIAFAYHTASLEDPLSRPPINRDAQLTDTSALYKLTTDFSCSKTARARFRLSCSKC